MLRYEICFGTTGEMRVFESLNIEQELSLWLYLLQHSGCAQGLAYPFSVVTLFSSFGVAELEQEVRCIIHRSVSVRSEWLRLRIFFVFFSAVFVVGGIGYVRWYFAMIWLFGPLRFLLCFVLFWLVIYADLLSPSVHRTRVEVLTPQLLCLAAVWLSGLLFLPLCDYGLIMFRCF